MWYWPRPYFVYCHINYACDERVNIIINRYLFDILSLSNMHAYFFFFLYMYIIYNSAQKVIKNWYYYRCDNSVVFPPFFLLNSSEGYNHTSKNRAVRPRKTRSNFYRNSRRECASWNFSLRTETYYYNAIFFFSNSNAMLLRSNRCVWHLAVISHRVARFVVTAADWVVILLCAAVVDVATTRRQRR